MEIKTLKSFYVIKESLENLEGPENISNNSLIESLKEELNYCPNENLTKISIIKSLTRNHCILATVIASDTNQAKPYDQKHELVSKNRAKNKVLQK